MNWEFWRRLLCQEKFNSRTFINNANLAAARADLHHTHTHTLTRIYSHVYRILLVKYVCIYRECEKEMYIDFMICIYIHADDIIWEIHLFLVIDLVVNMYIYVYILYKYTYIQVDNYFIKFCWILCSAAKWHTVCLFSNWAKAPSQPRFVHQPSLGGKQLSRACWHLNDRLQSQNVRYKIQIRKFRRWQKRNKTKT